MSTAVLSTVDRLRANVSRVAWGPLIGVARRLVQGFLNRIEIGQLVIEEHGESTVYGSQNLVIGSPPIPVTTLKIMDDTFWLRVAAFSDMGLAESYMLGEFECPDLTTFFRIFIMNRGQLSNGMTWTSSISSKISGMLAPLNNLSNAQLHISAHYDLSNEMFASFLSPDMTYSCPIWQTYKAGKTVEQTLYDAQLRKLDYIADQARIKQSDHVLEIGTGWGSFAIRTVQRFSCRVTSLTLSKEQKELAETRIAEAGLSDRIKVLLCDYRLHNGTYDKIVSIEMLEAVGREYLDTYFSCIDKSLRKTGGIAVFQCITIPEARYEAYSRGQDFIRKYIFPGGHLPCVTQLIDSITKGSKGELIVDNVCNIGPHYARTLREWRQNFLANYETFKPANNPDIFKRKWEYYFTYCEAGFNTKTLGDHIITVSREGALEQLEGIPL